MKIFPAVHYSMGGMWVDYNQMTNIPGLFAAGECEYQYHGANRLGANSLVSAIYGGMMAGPKAVEYIKGLKKSVQDISSTVFDSFHSKQVTKYESLLAMSGNENAYVIHKELGEWMTNNMTVVRHNAKLEATIAKIKELKERYLTLEQPRCCFYPSAVEYAGAVRGDDTWSPSAERKPRSPLQAGIPGT